MSFPNFFIVGAAKAGSTSLYHYLKQHPEVYLSPIKEPNYFCTDIIPSDFRPEYRKKFPEESDSYFKGKMDKEIFQAFIRDEKKYKQLFSNVKNEKAVGEVSNSYLFSSVAAINIKKIIPDAKILIVLRNPIERAYSHYLMDLRTSNVTGKFLDELKNDWKSTRKGWGISNLYAELGMYYDQVKRYTDLFPPHQIKIILFDDFINRTEEIMKEVFTFLNIDPSFKPDFSERYNTSVIPRNRSFNKSLRRIPIEGIKNILPKFLKKYFCKILFTKHNIKKIEPEERKFLLNIFSDDIMRLSKLINRDLKHWMS